MKIVEVRCFQVSGSANIPPSEQRQAQMLDIYPDYAARGPNTTPTTRLNSIFVEVVSQSGASGIFGPIFAETAFLIKEKLARYVVGQDAIAVERIWDQLYRQDRHARKGNQMIAISAIDNAVWDLRGKLLNLPVYRLLGGPTRDTVACYASMLGFSHETTLVRERAQMVVEQGYKAQKWFFRYGPGDGLDGMAKNVELIKTVREAVGPRIEIMVDAFMGWDATYTIRMLERIKEFNPRWMEESVPPDRISDFVAIKRSTNIPIATGEHEYTRWGFLQLLQAEAIDVIQADPDWCGGISELVKIGVLASAFGRHVVPHGHSIHAALHVIASQSPATFPMAEFLLLSLPSKQHFFREPLVPVNGAFALPTGNGLGISLDDAKIESRVEL